MRVFDSNYIVIIGHSGGFYISSEGVLCTCLVVLPCVFANICVPSRHTSAIVKMPSARSGTPYICAYICLGHVRVCVGTHTRTAFPLSDWPSWPAIDFSLCMRIKICKYGLYHTHDGPALYRRRFRRRSWIRRAAIGEVDNVFIGPTKTYLSKVARLYLNKSNAWFSYFTYYTQRVSPRSELLFLRMHMLQGAFDDIYVYTCKYAQRTRPTYPRSSEF